MDPSSSHGADDISSDIPADETGPPESDTDDAMIPGSSRGADDIANDMVDDIPAGETGPPDPDAAPVGGALSGPPAGGRPRRGVLASLWPIALLLVISATGLGLAALSRGGGGTEGAVEEPAGERSPPGAGAPSGSVRAVMVLRDVVLAAGACVLVSLLFARARRWLLPPPKLAPRATWGGEQLVYGVALAVMILAAAGLLPGSPAFTGVLAEIASQIAIAGVVIALVITRPGIMPGACHDTNKDAQDGQDRRAASCRSCTSLLNAVGRIATLGISFKGAGGNALRGVAGGLGAFSLAIAASVGGVLVSELVGSPVQDHPVIRRIFSAGAAETAVLVAGACAVAPVVEEVFFRGFIYPVLRDRWGMLAGTVASALAFSAVHPGLPNQAATFVLGAALAALYERSGTLVAPVVAHALFNGVQITMVLLARAVG